MDRWYASLKKRVERAEAAKNGGLPPPPPKPRVRKKKESSSKAKKVRGER